MMYARLLLDALEVENDASVFPELFEQYGLWQTPKAYLHSYPENQIILNWDRPLKRFHGMTAYEVSRDLGFKAHGSQVRSFAWYFGGRAKASEIPKYSPCEFGQCRSLVGEDVEKDDFFENLSGYRGEEDRRRPLWEVIGGKILRIAEDLDYAAPYRQVLDALQELFRID